MKTWIGRKPQSACDRESRLVLSEQDDNTPGVLRAQRQAVIARAAHATHLNGHITKVHVVLNERPPYEEIARYRQVAKDQDLDMTVDGSGTISMWRHDPSGLRRTDG